MRPECVNGYELLSVEVRLLACADDLTVFSKDMQSVSKVVPLTGYVCEVTGVAVLWGGKSGISFTEAGRGTHHF